MLVSPGCLGAAQRKLLSSERGEGLVDHSWHKSGLWLSTRATLQSGASIDSKSRRQLRVYALMPSGAYMTFDSCLFRVRLASISR